MVLFRVGSKTPITMKHLRHNVHWTRSIAWQFRPGRLGIALAVTILIPLGSNAQNVVSTSGGIGSDANSTVSWTIGQPVANTVSGAEGTLTQGFQQPWADIGTVVGEHVGSGSDIRVYPNPTRHLLNVEMLGTATGANALELLDAAGRLVLQAPTTGDRTELDLTDYGTGNYFLHIKDAEGDVTRTFQVIINH